MIREERYQEALGLLYEVGDLLHEKGTYIYLIETYLKQKLNLPIDEINSNDSYLCMQLKDYSVDRCVKHISKHFVEDVDLYHLINLVRENKKYCETYHTSFSDEVCYFRYDHIGDYSADTTKSDIIRAIFIEGTDDLITLYTCANAYYYQAYDITPIKVKKEVKTLSRIDKFKQKYNL